MFCGKENVILGLPWLQTINPTVYWSCQTISISETCDQSKDLYSIHATDTECHNAYFQKLLSWTPRHVNMDAVTNQHLYKFLCHKTENQFIAWAKRNQALHQIIWGASHFVLGSPVVARLTTTMELAAAAEKAKPPIVLPKEFSVTVFLSFLSSSYGLTISPPMYGYNVTWSPMWLLLAHLISDLFCLGCYSTSRQLSLGAVPCVPTYPLMDALADRKSVV